MLYRVAEHVADSDQQALEEVSSVGGGQRASFATSNRTLDDAVANAGYYGRDIETQRGRLARRNVEERIELGQLLVGSPDTVLSQVKWVRDELGAGVLDLIFAPVGRAKSLKAIELFGTKVLPRMHEL